MKIAIVGHRGSGKSTLHKRLRTQYPNQIFFDLDEFLESKYQKSIQDLFAESGEVDFRVKERMAFEEICSSHESFICFLGGGFDPELIPENIFVIFVRRATDPLGRVFLDRPRLNVDQPHLEEYLSRYLKRNERFLKRANWIYDIPEGLLSASAEEEEILFSAKIQIQGYWTFYPGNERLLRTLIERTGIKIEIRDDLLEEDYFLRLKNLIPLDRLLISVRKGLWSIDSYRCSPHLDVDVNVNRSDLRSDVVSCHDHDVSKLDNHPGKLLKWSPLIETWSQLKEALDWQNHEPQKRSFLPRSTSGRWTWVRQYLWNRQSINFCKLGTESSNDQPTLFEALSSVGQGFAAVLGDPVAHSATPGFHHLFFKKIGLPVFRILVPRGELKEAKPILIQMGLRAAAITAPLKKEAFLLSEYKSVRAEEFQSANTWFVDRQGTHCDFTDEVGLVESFPVEHKSQKGLVYGGGGTLDILRKHFPDFKFEAARGPRLQGYKPQVLIWAAGQSGDYAHLDLSDLRFIYDLSYLDFSIAKQIAAEIKCRYQSGWLFFKGQALEQQKVWSAFFEQ